MPIFDSDRLALDYSAVIAWIEAGFCDELSLEQACLTTELSTCLPEIVLRIFSKLCAMSWVFPTFPGALKLVLLFERMSVRRDSDFVAVDVLVAPGTPVDMTFEVNNGKFAVFLFRPICWISIEDDAKCFLCSWTCLKREVVDVLFALKVSFALGAL